MLRGFAAKLSPRMQLGLKLAHHARHIRNGTFATADHEHPRLHEWVKAGDTVIDVGANVGHYTRRLSELVGPTGRVYSFEPMRETFAVLSGLMVDRPNVTLLNMAASNTFGATAMSVAEQNFYEAKIGAGGDHRVQCMPVDALGITSCALLKIDAEGHDMQVLEGAEALIRACRPVVIVEGLREGVQAQWFRARGYTTSKQEGSGNVVGIP